MASVHYLTAARRWRVTWKPTNGGGRKSRQFVSETEARAFAASVPCRSRSTGSLAERLSMSIEQSPNGCWIWTRNMMNRGYGQIAVAGRMRLAHRVSYEVHVGPIPEGRVLDHLCRERRCINPQHLEPVVQRENVLRSPIAPGAINARKTHCAQGHEYSAENTYVYDQRPARSTTTRVCKTCSSEWSRKSRAARRARLTEKEAS